MYMQNSLKKLRRRRMAKLAFILCILFIFLRLYIFIPTDVTGISMYPTLSSNDKVLMSTVSRIERFDIIVFTDPMNKTVVKRVIGLPGETIRYEQDQLYINDEAIAEPFLNRPEIIDEKGLWTSNFTYIGSEGTVVPEGQYFLMGDNRRYSYDSRFYGSIAEEELIGEVLMLYDPIERFEIFQ